VELEEILDEVDCDEEATGRSYLGGYS